MAITDIISRVPSFGRSFVRDNVPRHDDPIEARRHGDLREDLSAMQQAVDTVNNLGMPAAPSFQFIMHTDGTGTGETDEYYKSITHDLGFTPTRWAFVWDNEYPKSVSTIGNGRLLGWPIPHGSLGAGDPDNLWTDSTVAFKYLADGQHQRTVRIVLFRV
ncbi:MAG: hypothetical protein GY937_20155 [bacterium]|nr:hypothetical protein [bacterium]